MTTPMAEQARAIHLPFLKWAGGKRWLTQEIQARVGSLSGKYIEPFVGSGAVYFSLAPRRAVLSDVNDALIETFQCVRDNPDEIEAMLSEHNALHSKDYYYSVRSAIPTRPAQRAARFIYLNRTCWNGLYRVNLEGRFNVPIGTKTSAVLKTDNWKALSDLLSGAKLLSGDFETSIDLADANDTIFADPPYTVKHNFNGFIKYNEALFSWNDQIRLRDALLRAKSRGARIISTNADHESIRELYCDHFEMERLSRSSVLSGDPAYRGRFTELLITTGYDKPA